MGQMMLISWNRTEEINGWRKDWPLILKTAYLLRVSPKERPILEPIEKKKL
jgi:hypothetical protein